MDKQMADRNFSENEHAWVEERLSAFVDDQLAPLEHAQLTRHLRDCARCQSSLASLRWTISLVKQAPAPTLPKMFTLPVPAQTQRASLFGFGLARLATVLATLVLFTLIGVDAISRLGGGFAASAPAALQSAAQPTSVALAPQVQDQAKQSSPTSSPIIQFAATQPTATASETRAPLPAALPPAPASAPTSRPNGPTGLGSGPEAAETTSPSVKSAASPLPRAPAVAPAATSTVNSAPAAGAALAATLVLPSPSATLALPTATATAVIPSANATARPSLTPNVQAYTAPTLSPLPPRQFEPAREIASPLRLAEIGLFFLVIFFAAVTVLLRRK
jgi:anti-sigma factor RsiW